MSHSNAGTGDPSERPASADTLPTKTPPGPDGIPMIGSALSLVRHPRAFYDEMSASGDVVSYRLPRMQFYTVLHPDLIEHVLLDDYEKYAKWGFEDFGASLLLGDW